MAINTYIDLQTMKSLGGMNIATAGYDSRLLAVSDAVSRGVDRFCNRRFYFYSSTLDFDGPGSRSLFVPDLVSVSALSEDSNLNGTFDTTYSSADYILYPLTSLPTSNYGDARPYTRVEVSDKSGGSLGLFNAGRANYRISGTWGYQKVVATSGLNGTAASTGTTQLILSAPATGTIEPGHTVEVGTEMMYVNSASGSVLSVSRGVNGSTPGTHTGSAVSIVQYPSPVVEAVMIMVARLWRRKDSAYATQIGIPESGQIQTYRGMDADVKILLQPHRKWAI